MIYTLTGVTIETDFLGRKRPETGRRFGYFLTLKDAQEAIFEDAIIHDWLSNGSSNGEDPLPYLIIEAQMPGVQDLDGYTGYVDLDKTELYQVYWDGRGEDADLELDIVPREKWPAWAHVGYNFTFDLEG